MDNVILVQEALNSNNLRKEKGMLIKLDMKNAFNQVKHSYLYKVLSSFGFSKDFISLIKSWIDKP